MTKHNVQTATDMLEQLIAQGMEFPDAVWKASSATHIKAALIEAEYDRRQSQ
jgi:hypothetical protein